MNEKETRRLKEILFALLYAKYLQHGTDGHHRLSLIAEQAKGLGYSFGHAADQIWLMQAGNVILTVTATPDWSPE